MKHEEVLSELISLLAHMQEPQLLEDFLRDLLTPQELEEICSRWELIKLLADGVPQREIAQRLGLSIGKVSRGAREWKYGHGGFRRALELLREIQSDSNQT